MSKFAAGMFGSLGNQMADSRKSDLEFKKQAGLEEIRGKINAELEGARQLHAEKLQGKRLEVEVQEKGKDRTAEDERARQRREQDQGNADRSHELALRRADAELANFKDASGARWAAVESARKAAEAQGVSLQTDAEGNAIRLNLKDGTTAPIVGTDGKPIKLASKNSQTLDPKDMTELAKAIPLLEGKAKADAIALLGVYTSSLVSRHGAPAPGEKEVVIPGQAKPSNASSGGAQKQGSPAAAKPSGDGSPGPGWVRKMVQRPTGMLPTPRGGNDLIDVWENEITLERRSATGAR
jgi:hypothetical protein